ncbi:MAG TPA: beta-ketoacyl-ACP synthase III [Syntrophomonadaceae bacterium]|nr:beta-ketoacyl-ACP synthase III [Syntrophomonadaceae bacterium]
MRVQIKGVGYSLPSKILTNQDLERMVDTSDQWITERTGILERRIAEPGTATSDYCYEAARMALEQAQITPDQLDLIIIGTTSPDMLFPSTACIVQERLQAWNAGAFDMEAGCTGFVYGMSVAEKFLLSPSYRNILVVGSDMCSRFVDYTDRDTCIIFGDGAGAAVVSRGSDSHGILSSYLGADGRGGKHLYMPGGGSAMPASAETVEQKQHFIKMNGQEIFKFATVIIEQVANRLLDQAGLTYEDVDIFVPHQANLRIIKAAMRRMNIPAEKTLINIQKYGNMSAACIPVALAEADREGILKPGQLVLMIAFGAGLTYGGILMRWGSDENAI